MLQSTLLDPACDLRHILGGAPATPLIESPDLARRVNVGRVFLKMETQRPLGNFKVLGGMLAGLRALARHRGTASVAELLGTLAPTPGLPTLICASDGNHGLAVAAAARRARTSATIYLAVGVDAARVRRIESQGAAVEWVRGTYDDAVDAAEQAAARGDGLLVADTTRHLDDPIVRDVMEGYSLIAREIVEQFRDLETHPTHAFVQAGVGGLAAALASGVSGSMRERCQWLVVEPAAAACVARALAAGAPVRIEGALETAADMLSCGLASAPAIRILQSVGATAVVVDESKLLAAVDLLRDVAGVDTTPSGAAGLAGLLQTGGLGPDSCVLLLITEGPITA